jgi:hypothetical protein
MGANKEKKMAHSAKALQEFRENLGPGQAVFHGTRVGTIVQLIPFRARFQGERIKESIANEKSFSFTVAWARKNQT